MITKVLEYLTKLWYAIFRVEGYKMKKEGILDARELACYIQDKYKKIGGEISPIKLQKSLYFCFAYWGGFVRSSELGNSELNKKYNELLFDNRIEAWVYGPVVPDVYHEGNLESYRSCKKNIFNDDFVKSYIDGVLEDVLAANDFKLVEVSHEDKCWKKHFKTSSLRHNNEIPHEEIIKEYAIK